jgi:hypothetical protein
MFRLTRAGRVTLVVQQLWPVCRTIARLTIKGHRGLNTVTLRPRIHRHRLTPGTYRLTLKTWKHGRGRSVIIAVVSRKPSRSALAAVRSRNACSSVLGAATGGLQSGGAFARSGSLGSGSAGGAYRPPSQRTGAKSATKEAAAAAPTPAAQAVPLLNPTQGPLAWLRMLLVAGFAFAAVLLATAAVPAAAARGTRVGEIVVRRRGEIMLLGTATLLAFAIAYVLATFR